MSRDRGWEGRPWAARFVRWFAFLGPIVVSVLVTVWISRQLPPPTTFWGALGLWLLLGVVATAIASLLDLLARRLLPLAALLQLSLAFPGEVPSRYRVARTRGGSKQLAAEVQQAREHGLSDDRTEAAVTVLQLVAALSTHDRATRGHAERVRVFTDMIAEELDLGADDVDRLRWAALLHDVGKIAVHPDVLNDPGRPSEEAWELIRTHPLEGARITAPLRPWLGDWALAIEQHHERWDGAGYPHGLAGEELSLGARIIGVADSYDVMTAARAYKQPMPAKEAREELARNAGTQFDPGIVRAFLAIPLQRLRWAVGPFSWLVSTRIGRPFQSLSTGAESALASSLAGAVAVAAVIPGLGPPDRPSTPDVVAVEEVGEPEATTDPDASPSVAPSAAPDEPAPSASPTAGTDATPAPTATSTPSVAPSTAPTPATPTSLPPIVVAATEDDVVTIDVFATARTRSVSRELTSAAADVGTVQWEPAGVITWTPPLDWSGTATIAYTVADGGVTLDGVVTVSVTAVDDPPRPVPDIVLVVEDGQATVDVLANDVEGDGEPLAVLDVELTGATTQVQGGLVTVVPAPDTNGLLTGRVTVSDGRTAVTSRLAVFVRAVNDAPTITLGPPVQVPGDAGAVTLPAWAAGITPGPADEAGQTLDVTVAVDRPELFATAPTLDLATGDLSFVTAGADGTATLRITVRDDGGTTLGGADSTTVSTTITVVGGAVVAVDDTATVVAGGSVVIGVLGNDLGASPLRIVGLDTSTVRLGTVVDIGGGNLRYVADDGVTGTDTFTYTAANDVGRATATVTVTVE